LHSVDRQVESVSKDGPVEVVVIFMIAEAAADAQAPADLAQLAI
jgi:hypothetical protein